MKKLYFLFLFMLFACEDQSTEPDDPRSKAYYDAAFMEIENEEYSVLGVHENGSMMAIKPSVYGNSALSAVYFL